MSTKPIKQEGIPPEIMNDMEYAVYLVATGKKDADFVHRIRTKAEHITQEIQEKHGVLDIGVPAIRELRGELPQP